MISTFVSAITSLLGRGRYNFGFPRGGMCVDPIFGHRIKVTHKFYHRNMIDW
jgi:hypothetical protein